LGWKVYGRRFVEETADEILSKNLETIRKMVGAIRRVWIGSNVGISMCIKPASKEITEWAWDVGEQPILHCGEDEEFITVFFGAPDPYISRREVAESIAERLLDKIFFLKGGK